MNRKDFRPSNESSSSNNTSRSYALEPKYDSKKSFYGKAKVRVENGKLVLKSYDTDVAYIKDGHPVVTNTQSPTTIRHVKEFLKQNGYKADSLKQIEKDYGKDDYSEEIRDEQQAQKDYAKLEKQHPEDKKSIEEIRKDEKTHEQILTKLNKIKHLEHSTEAYHGHKIDIYETTDNDYRVYVDGNFTRTMGTKSNAENYGKTWIDNAFKHDNKSGRMTLSEIRTKNESAGQYFFSKDTLRLYRQVNAKYRTRYDKKTDSNYVIVNMKKFPESTERREVVYKYNKDNGHLDIQQ